MDQKEGRVNEALQIFMELYVELDDKINGKGFEDAVGVLRRWYGETIRKLESIKNSRQASDMNRLTVNVLREHMSKLAAADEANEDEWTDFGRRLIGFKDRMRVKEKDLLEVS